MSEATILTLTAPGQRDVTLIIRDVDGDPLPLAYAYVEQLSRMGYSSDVEIAAVTDPAGCWEHDGEPPAEAPVQ